MGILNSSDYICALDISSSKVSGAVAKIKRKDITDIFFETLPSKGIKRGSISDSIALITCVEAVLKNLKTKSGINIAYIYINISGENIITKHSRAIVPLAERGNKIITLSDIQKVNEQARILGSSLEEEIIDEIPFGYTIDSRNNISSPLGLYSHKLEVDLYLVCAKLSSLQTLTRVINQAGYEIKDLFFSAVATSQGVFDIRSRNFTEQVNILCDIGSDITEILIFKNAMLKDIAILPVGGDDLTIALSEALNIPFELAEEVKKSYGRIQDFNDAGTQQDKEILIKKDNIYKPIKQKAVVDIVTSKAKLISGYIKEKIQQVMPFNEVNNLVVCGRTVLLEGFIEVLENNLGATVKLARAANPKILSLAGNNDVLSGHKYLTYLTTLGMVSKALQDEQIQFMPDCNASGKHPVSKIFNRIKEVCQEYF